MELISTRAAIWDVVHTMRELTVEQILRYFRSEASKKDLLRFIAQHIKEGTFACPDYADTYLKLRADEIDEEAAASALANCKITLHQAKWEKDRASTQAKQYNQRILTSAFWPVAELGCEVIKEVIPVNTISKSATLLFCTMDKQHYDLTWCFIPGDIKKASKEWSSHIYEQPINHIALVKTRELGCEALAAGFDSYCILDKDHHPQYYTE